ncbi:helix-turn-helix transcriptional regulator [Pseudonocardia sp. CA-107938]|uniref:helix-turn-helix transcriptional regulator n=1 Tax=Pseudonocardia sp. CA-107938 TaxID=3240021 RepID=UPI003D9098E9
MRTQSDQWLTGRQVAALIGVSPNTLRRWRHNSIGPAASRLGPRAVRYERAAVDEWLRTRQPA